MNTASDSATTPRSRGAAGDVLRITVLLGIFLCGGCAGHSAADDIDYTALVKTVDAPTIRQWMEEGRSFSIVDVRSTSEYENDGHVPDVDLHPYSIYNRDPMRNEAFVEEMEVAFEPDATIVLICSHAMRASQAAHDLQRKAGFTNVYVFPGGYEGHHMKGYPSGDGWKAAGLPLED
jgi:rhodanese-related sulfurtransferase